MERNEIIPLSDCTAQQPLHLALLMIKSIFICAQAGRKKERKKGEKAEIE